MEALKRQIGKARARLLAQSFVSKLGWCWCATLTLAAIAIAAGKYWPLVDERTLALSAIGSALGLGAIAAGLWTWLDRQSTFEIAAEIDRRFGLKERISSTLSLAPEQMNSEIGQALMADAIRRAERVDVPDAFRVRLTRSSLFPLAPAAIAFVLALFVGTRVAPTVATANAAEAAHVKKPLEALAKTLEQQKKAREEAGLGEEEETALTQLLDGAKQLAEKPLSDRKQTLVALNDLVKNAEKRRQDLAASAEIKQQFNQLKNLQQGPAQKMASALKTGDLKKAVDEISKLQKQLLDEKLTTQEKEALSNQLQQMSESMEKMVQAHKEAKQDLQQKIDQERRAGNTGAAEKLQQQLDKLTEKSMQMEQLNKMAAQAKAAAQQMKNGKNKEAAEAMAQLSEKLSEMAADMDELASLDDAIEQIGDAKNAMACKECEGDGCAACQGQGEKFSDKWMRADWAKGGGVGAGKRDKQETDANFIDSQVSQNVGKGGMVVQGPAGGPNKKGQVQEEIKGEFSGAAQQSAEALSDQRLPHEYRDHAKSYFDAVREGSR